LPGNEEPTPASEFDVSSDGRDEYGEEMIRELPRNPDLEKLKVAPQPANVLPLRIVVRGPTDLTARGYAARLFKHETRET